MGIESKLFKGGQLVIENKFESVWFSPRNFANEGVYIYGSKEKC